MDKEQAASDIIAAGLPLAAFEGWNLHMLKQAAVAAGYKETDVIRVFPGGAIEAADVFSRLSDAHMLEELQQLPLAAMKIRERIAAGVRLRIGMHAPHREALRKIAALHALPLYATHGLGCLYDTADAIWRACGDTSTDFNFYTKRLMLAGVYASTLLCWLDDKSEGSADSWAFLDRRIGNVMSIEKWKGKLRSRPAA